MTLTQTLKPWSKSWRGAALFCTALAAMVLLGSRNASANPFASGIIVTNGTVQFYINESGGSVTVTYEDGSTNSSFNGITTGTNVASGLYSFSLGTNTSYQITCHKNGTGTPFAISTSEAFGTPRGVDADKNPKNGAYFGRVYVGESSPSGSRTRGIYMLSPDLSTNLAPGGGFNSLAGGVFTNASSSSPYRITVGPDNNVYAADYSTAGATVYSFDAGFAYQTNLVLSPVGENQGLAAGTHGDPNDVFTTGSLATSNLVVYTFDAGLPISTAAALWYVDQFGNNIYHLGSEGYTTPGSYENAYQYNIGAGPLPWTNGPNRGVCLGLPTFQDTVVGGVTIETNGYMLCEFDRANFSDGDIQVYDTNFNIIYTSLQPNGTDPFNSPSEQGYAYAGVRISPDGNYLMTVSIDNEIEVCYLTNGIPDVSSLQLIPTVNAVGNSRGCAFDAADNILYVSSGQGLLGYYSLGLTSTCITSNDITGTNGTFSFTLPPVTASLAISQPTASQNYISTGGTPIPGVFSITLNTNQLNAPVTVNFSLAGTATNNVNYTLNTGTNSAGVFITNNYVVFPAGTYSGVGNWTVNITVTPTASPLSGPTFVESVTLGGGTSYIRSEPVSGSLTILNTGPQQLVLSAALAGATMSRAVSNDYAEFVLTRYGDINSRQYTITNFNYGGTAVFPSDFTAGAQTFTGTGFVPVDGSPGIVISPGVSAITNIVGNPVPRANLYEPATNVTITISLTNAITGSSLTSLEGVAYTVNPATVTLTELDHVYGGEVVLWSNPLTNSADSTNWTLTFATPSLNPSNTVLPVVVRNYSNTSADAIENGGTNDYEVTFGNPVVTDGLAPSPAMIANGWSNVLKASVENSVGSPAGVNLFPQGVTFYGNYALRFDMYLKLYDRAEGNPYYAGTVDRQYALFGINTKGTNCDYRPTATVLAGTGSGATNWDGQWFAIDAGTDAQTPADFDGFSSPALPNSGSVDTESEPAYANAGLFKSPPFAGIYNRFGTLGGEPVDKWVSVSAETTLGTNVSLYINGSPVIPSFSSTNGTGNVNGGYTNGTIMLGYENPLANVSDGSAFAYFSNVRVVELSPDIVGNGVSVIATNNQTVSFTNIASFASAPLTNTWYTGLTNPVVAITTSSVNATGLTSILTLPSVQTGTNYVSVFSDAAGSITGLVVSLEVIQGPTNVIAPAGSTVTFAVTPSGQSAPTSEHWKLNGTNLLNGTTYSGVTTTTLTISNVQASGVYVCAVTNTAGVVTPAASLTVIPVPPPALSSLQISGTNVLIGFSTADALATTNSFTLLASPVVTGPYLPVSSAVFSGTSGTYQILVPQPTNNTMFYQLKDGN